MASYCRRKEQDRREELEEEEEEEEAPYRCSYISTVKGEMPHLGIGKRLFSVTV